jgi:hypothetical protein
MPGNANVERPLSACWSLSSAAEPDFEASSLQAKRLLKQSNYDLWILERQIENH